MVRLAQESASVPLAEHAERVRSTQRAMAERGLDAMLIVSPENIYYLVGLDHQGYFAFTMLILHVESEPVLVSRAMERSTVAAQVPGCVHEAFEDDEDPTAAAIRAVNSSVPAGSRVGIELDTMFFPPRIVRGLMEEVHNVEWADASGLVEQLRAVKSPTELTWVRAAALASDEAMRAGIEAARPGVSEREIAAAVYHQLVRSGSEYPGFAPLIRSNGNLLQEHVTWSGRRLASGDMLFLELSASVRRYHAPLTRMVHFDKLPPRTSDVAEIALAGLEEIRQNLRPGAVVGDVYDAWQRIVDEGLGHKLYRRHHCGYAVGIGYPPSWVGGSTVVGIRRGGHFVVREGMVFHVLSWIIGQEPADYVVSDTAVVTAEGCELLTATPREPLIV
ncbi:MAG: M24 family metallopeptidase [Streptosporangiales bacterium]|nr:M24 family metallopeptidase [Streptosporangiales bacterium]